MKNEYGNRPDLYEQRLPTAAGCHVTVRTAGDEGPRICAQPHYLKRNYRGRAAVNVPMPRN